MRTKRKPGIAFIDVDHTLTRHATGLRFARDLLANGLIHFHDLARVPSLYLWYRVLPFRRQAAKETEHTGLLPIGLKEDSVRSLTADFFERQVLPDLYQESRDLLEKLKNDGWSIILATSSFDILISALARYYNADGFIANAIEFKDGFSTGNFKPPLIFGESKLQACRRLVSDNALEMEACAFYSDSIHDLPLLEAVGHPVAVNPDWRLNRHARRHAWPRVRFKR